MRRRIRREEERQREVAAECDRLIEAVRRGSAWTAIDRVAAGSPLRRHYAERVVFDALREGLI